MIFLELFVAFFTPGTCPDLVLDSVAVVGFSAFAAVAAFMSFFPSAERSLFDGGFRSDSSRSLVVEIARAVALFGMVVDDFSAFAAAAALTFFFPSVGRSLFDEGC